MFGTNTFSQVPFSAAPGLLYSAALSDTAVALMVVSAAAAFTPNISEAATSSDVFGTNFSVAASISETAVAIDTMTSSVVFPVQFSDAAVAQDQSRSAVNFLASLSESSIAQDSSYTYQAFLAAVSENAVGLDLLLGRELWEQIDDTQLAGWTDILVPTTIEDIAVFGGANFGVLSFAGNSTQRYDPNPVFWKQVDDTQDTVWTDIVAV